MKYHSRLSDMRPIRENKYLDSKQDNGFSGVRATLIDPVENDNISVIVIC